MSEFKITRTAPSTAMTNPTDGKVAHVTPKHKRRPVYTGSIYEHIVALMEQQPHIESVWVDPEELHYHTYPVTGWTKVGREQMPEVKEDINDLI